MDARAARAATVNLLAEHLGKFRSRVTSARRDADDAIAKLKRAERDAAREREELEGALAEAKREAARLRAPWGRSRAA